MLRVAQGCEDKKYHLKIWLILIIKMDYCQDYKGN